MNRRAILTRLAGTNLPGETEMKTGGRIVEHHSYTVKGPSANDITVVSYDKIDWGRTRKSLSRQVEELETWIGFLFFLHAIHFILFYFHD